MAEAGTILWNYFSLSICKIFLFHVTLLFLSFPSFTLIFIKEREIYMPFLQKRCSLIQIQNSCSVKDRNNFKVGIKNIIFGYFTHILKNIRIYTKKKLKVWTKNTLIRHFRDVILQKYCHIWNKHSRTFQHATFYPKQKRLSTKTPSLRIFRLEYEKDHWHIWNQQSQVCQSAKLLAKQKPLNLGPKMSYLGIIRL